MPTISIFLNLNVHEIDIQIAHDAPCLLPNLVRRRVYLHKSVETPEAMCQFYLPVKLQYTTQENEERCDGHSKGRPCWGHRKTPVLWARVVARPGPHLFPPTARLRAFPSLRLVLPAAVDHFWNLQWNKLSQNPKSHCVKSVVIAVIRISREGTCLMKNLRVFAVISFAHVWFRTAQVCLFWLHMMQRGHGIRTAFQPLGTRRHTW